MTLRRVPLLAVNLSITLEDFMNDRQEWLQLRRPGLRAAIAGRFRVRQNLLQRLPVNLVFGTSGPLADLSVQDPRHESLPISPCQ